MKEKDTLVGALNLVEQRERDYLLDSLYCDMFNSGNALVNDTEEHDVDCFARNIWHDMNPSLAWHVWDMIDDRKYWLKLARVCLDRLPGLMDSIGRRCQLQAKAINSLLQADKKRKDK